MFLHTIKHDQILRCLMGWFLYLTFAQTILFFQSFGHFLFLLEEFCSIIVFKRFVFSSKLQIYVNKAILGLLF